MQPEKTITVTQIEALAMHRMGRREYERAGLDKRAEACDEAQATLEEVAAALPPTGSGYAKCVECGDTDDPRRTTCLACDGQMLRVDPAEQDQGTSEVGEALGRVVSEAERLSAHHRTEQEAAEAENDVRLSQEHRAVAEAFDDMARFARWATPEPSSPMETEGGQQR